MYIKDIESNSRIISIGSLFCYKGRSEWYININLEPVQQKKYLKISQIPVLARHRTLNPLNISLEGNRRIININNSFTWKSETIKYCHIKNIKINEVLNQWCFVFDHDEVRYYSPQIELARVLFYHHANFVRLSLIPGGLAQDFGVECINHKEVKVNILQSCTLPSFVRKDHALRRVLAWILLDSDARKSFESIARYQLQGGNDAESYRTWCFRFDPPKLEKVKLKINGHYDKKSKAFFVYEIHEIANLSCDCPELVVFHDPLFTEKEPGQRHAVRPNSSSNPQVVVDDDQEPNSDKSEMRIDIPKVTFEFANPFRTTLSDKKYGQFAAGQAKDSKKSINETVLEVSTDESNILGTLQSADYDGLEDNSNDAHLYAPKFNAFKQMVDQLVNKQKYIHIRRVIRKLPNIKGFSKHLLTDGNPRCLDFHLINHEGLFFALIEVDTSDNINRLSTLLLKQQISTFDWDRQLKHLEIQLLKCSLNWPTSFLKTTFGSDFKRIPHPKTASTNKSLLEQESIHHWAERVHSKIH
ncbi:Tn7-like element transposition protein TnsE [Desulfonatronum sp. SC1]|uniref:Tn7-like element transposition protein TnsE n=1 Tax=Desulfonatronum sp. SC1 TaxID=2109626 RepID=UPI000D31AB11|nr:Tn7-like element transposition protein TnsE [Desulfonatronum sp. SC1]PTN37333.1 transcriptional antiterminator [Desulfonatronum sp. SC1]